MLCRLIIFNNDLLFALYNAGVSSAGCFIRFYKWNCNFFFHSSSRFLSDRLTLLTYLTMVSLVQWRAVIVISNYRCSVMSKNCSAISLVISFLLLIICFFFIITKKAHIFDSVFIHTCSFTMP